MFFQLNAFKKWIGLLFCFLFSITVYASEKPEARKNKGLKILSYNILEGLKDKEKRTLFIKLVDSLQADILTLQECNHFTHESFLKFAQEHSYPYAVLLKEIGYPTGIISKYPIKNILRITDGFLHGYISAEIEGYQFVNLHLNPFMYAKRNAEMDVIISYLNQLPKNSKTIIMGDFNSLSPQDSNYYNPNKQKLNKLIAHEATRAYIRNVNNGGFDYSVISQLINRGYVDTWKYKNRDNYEKSAPTPVVKYDEDNDVRIDYIWVSEPLKSKINTAFMIKNVDTDRISDHYPQVLVLK